MSFELRKLEDVCDILDHMRIPITSRDRKEGPYPYYGANGIQDYIDDFIFDDELVLLAEDGGNFGSKEKPIAYRISGKTWVNNHAHVLKPKNIIDVDYLCYSLMYYDVSGLLNGATRQKLTQSEMRKINIRYRSLEKQRQMVFKIKLISNIISSREHQLSNLNLLVKSRFIEMFGDESTIVKMENICSIITDGTHQPPKFVGSGIPFLFVSNISSNEIRYDAEKFISDETYAELYKRTPIEIGDVILSTVGSYGHPAIVKSDKKFLFQRHIAYLKPKKNMINSVFLHTAILSDEVKEQIDRKVKGIAQKTLNLSDIRSLNIILPNIDKQNQFASFVTQVDKSKLAIQQSLDELETLKKSLMQQYFG